MTTGNIKKIIFAFAVPLMLSNLLQQLYNTVDAIIVGRALGSVALAAVGSSSLLVTFMIYFFIGLSQGASVLVSQAYGAKDREAIDKIVHTSIAMSVIAGAVLMIIGIVFAPTFLTWMQIPQEGMPFAVTYIRIYFLSMIPMMIYNVGSGILRAVGDSKTPLIYLAVTVAVNIVLDLLFIVVFPFGVGGAAAATSLAQLSAATLVIIRMMRTSEVYKLTLSRVRLNLKTFKRIVSIGLPAGLQSVLVCFANVVVQSQINRFGITIMAGFTSYMKIDGFIFMPIDAISMAISSFVGQNIGAGDWDRVKEGKRVAIIMNIIITIAFCIVIALFSHQIIGLFSSDEAVIGYGVKQIYWVVPLYFIYAYNQTIIGYLRGLGKTLVPMIISMTCMCLLRVSWILILKNFIDDPAIIYVSYPLTWIVSAIALTIYDGIIMQRYKAIQLCGKHSKEFDFA